MVTQHELLLLYICYDTSIIYYSKKINKFTKIRIPTATIIVVPHSQKVL